MEDSGEVKLSVCENEEEANVEERVATDIYRH